MAATAETIQRAGQPAEHVRIAGWAATPRSKLGAPGAELPLDVEESAIVDTHRRFAEQEMRPLGVRLDGMAPEAVIAPEPPLWPFYAKFNELVFTVDTIFAMPPQQRAKIICLFYETLDWGDSGPVISIGASTLPGFRTVRLSRSYCVADNGADADPKHGAVIIVRCDAKSVSRGKPLDKKGQRALNQGEVFSDHVDLPIEHLLAGPDNFQRAVYAIHTEANALMGATFTGVAQRA